MRFSKRIEFLNRMFLEAMKPYEFPGEEWTDDEKEFLPLFKQLLGLNKLILDLAGGYGRVTPHLMEGNNFVVLTDLSIHSLHAAKRNIKGGKVEFIRADLRYLPFRGQIFDGVWFTQAFEYVPPDQREYFLRELREILKDGGLVFMNVAKVPNECSLLSYIKNYIYWKMIKRRPIVWGEYIYKLKLPHYEGWHYHSVVFTHRIERTIRKTGFKILKSKQYDKNAYPLAYLLQVEKEKK